jgi:4-carboxymuconolactone decarboxylase
MVNPGPRIPPLPAHEWSSGVRALLTADLGDGSPLGARQLAELNLCTTLARHERTFSSLMRLGRGLIMGAALTFDDRELLILRTAWNCQSAYEWGEHVQISIAGGVERAIVLRVPAGPDVPGWDQRQRLLIRAADELHVSARIEDATWGALAQTMDEEALIEVPLVVGYYHLIAFALGALAIQPQAGLRGLPTRSER